MTVNDPWAPTSSVENEKEKIVTEASNSKIVVTLKQGAGYDASWLVIHAEDPQDAANQLSQVSSIGLPAAIAKAAQEFQATGGGAPAPVRQQSAPPAQQSAPAPSGGGKTCKHGDMVYKEFTSKAGKFTKLWGCPEQDRNQQCRAIFV